MRLPDLVLIMTDSQGADLTGAFNPALADRLQTRRIDALAEQGVACERAYTTCPLCSPARSGLFTGIYSQRSGAWTNSLALGTNVRHMGEWFQGLGYRTAYVGKWHLDGHDYFGTGICPPGWDARFWFDGRNYLDELTPAERRFWRTATTAEAFRAQGVDEGFTWAKRCNQRARRFVEECRRDDAPFVLVVSYDEPHHPWTCPPEDAEAFADFAFPVGPSWNEDLSRKPAHYRRWAAHGWGAPSAEFRAPAYFGCNRFVDRMVGEVVDLIDEAAQRPAYVLYTSDHGEMKRAHGGLAAKGPSAYEEIARIPFIVRGPGLQPGRRVRTPVSHADVLPTFLALAGVEAPPALDGASLLPILHGAEDPAREVVVEYHRYELSHEGFMDWSPMRALVGAEWKLSLHERHGDELIHLPGDPHELVNRIADPAAVAQRDAMHDRLLAWMDERRDPLRGGSWRQRAWRQVGEVPFRAPSRPNPADGLAPDYRDYDTGEPTRGSHSEYG